MKNLCFYLFLLLAIMPNHQATAQLASPVVDVPCNVIGAIARTVARASNAIKENILPIKEAISTVQTFFKQSHQVANGVIVNLRMCQQLIELEGKIGDLSLEAYQAIDNAENLPQKWKHKWVIANLYYEGRSLFEVFDFTLQQPNADGEKSIMDDQQRIFLIKDTLAKARKVYSAMKLSLRRTQRLEFKIRQKKAQLLKYQEFFEEL